MPCAQAENDTALDLLREDGWIDDLSTIHRRNHTMYTNPALFQRHFRDFAGKASDVI